MRFIQKYLLQRHEKIHTGECVLPKMVGITSDGGREGAQ